jgi:hypothetical protein
MNEKVQSPYRLVLREAIITQVLFALICLIFTDTERLAKLLAVMTVAFWCGVLLIIRKRPTSPTKGDLIFIRLGPLGMFLVFAIVGSLTWGILIR